MSRACRKRSYVAGRLSFKHLFAQAPRTSSPLFRRALAPETLRALLRCRFAQDAPSVAQCRHLPPGTESASDSGLCAPGDVWEGIWLFNASCLPYGGKPPILVHKAAHIDPCRVIDAAIDDAFASIRLPSPLAFYGIEMALNAIEDAGLAADESHLADIAMLRSPTVKVSEMREKIASAVSGRSARSC